VLKTMEPVNIRAILSNKGHVTADELAQMRRAIASDQVVQARVEIDALLRDVEGGGAAGSTVRAGIGAYLLGQHAIAERLLASAGDDGSSLPLPRLATIRSNAP
jgi:hypothetical protein